MQLSNTSGKVWMSVNVSPEYGKSDQHSPAGPSKSQVRVTHVNRKWWITPYFCIIGQWDSQFPSPGWFKNSLHHTVMITDKRFSNISFPSDSRDEYNLDTRTFAVSLPSSLCISEYKQLSPPNKRLEFALLPKLACQYHHNCTSPVRINWRGNDRSDRETLQWF